MDARFPHLPAGRAPGSQSRSRRTDRRLGAAMIALLGAFFAGLGVYGAADPGEAPPWLFLAIFLPLGAGCLAAAAWLVRHGRARAARHFAVEVTTPEVVRGGRVEARLRVADASAVRGRLEIGLVCTERYDKEEVQRTNNGTSRQRVTRDHVVHEDWQPVAPGQPLQQVAFDVPSGAPFSYEGRCLSFAWAVRAREARPGRVDPRCDAPFWVTP